MTVEEMKERKRELGYSYHQISEMAGVPLGTVQKIFGGMTAAPRYSTLQALEKVFCRNGMEEKMFDKQMSRNLVSQSQVKESRNHTIQDYYLLSDEQRLELMDGVFYDLAFPSTIHQLIAGQIYMKLAEYIASKQETCVPLIAPVDVQLECDEKTMLQPDVMVVWERSKILKTHIYGAPDFVVEVLSKSTKQKDMFVKADKYIKAGVREYWLVDSDKQKVIVYYFSEDISSNIYDFHSSIPVHLFNGDCQINFQEIYDSVKFLL